MTKAIKSSIVNFCEDIFKVDLEITNKEHVENFMIEEFSTVTSFRSKVMQCGRVEAESVTHNYYNSSTKPKFYKNTRLAGKIIEKTSLTNFY